MVRTPAKMALKKGTWSPEEHEKLKAYIRKYGIWNWSEMPKPAGLFRSGKSCRLRWVNYLRPGIKHGNFTREEEETILRMHEMLGNKWSAIAAAVPGRTDNEIKNHWHTSLKKHTRLKISDAESNQNINLPELNLLLPNAPEASSSDGSTNISVSPSTGPAVGINPNQDIEAYIGSETFREFRSLWEQLLSEENLYKENLHEPFLDPGFIIPHSELWFPQPSSPYDTTPTVGIIENQNVEAYINSETFGEVQSLWGQQVSEKNLYMENLQEAFLGPGFIFPSSELWCQEPTNPYSFYNDASNDLWFNLSLPAEIGGVNQPSIHF